MLRVVGKVIGAVAVATVVVSVVGWMAETSDQLDRIERILKPRAVK